MRGPLTAVLMIAVLWLVCYEDFRARDLATRRELHRGPVEVHGLFYGGYGP